MTNENGRKKPKYIIEFNKKIQFIHESSKENSIYCDKQDVFKFGKCFFNFDEDQLEIELRVHYAKLQKITFQNKSIMFSITNSRKIVKVPIIFEETKREARSEFKSIVIHGSFKNVNLHLFSHYKKKFVFNICYLNDNDTYEETFFAQIPNIDEQKDLPKPQFIPLYKPEDVAGFAICKSFDKDFHLKEDSKQDEIKLNKDLWKYFNSPPDEKFKEKEFLKVLRYAQAIEDMDSFKVMKKYRLTFQKIYRYDYCRYQLREEIDNHLRHLMCDEKKEEFILGIYIIEATERMPNDVMEFDYVLITDQFNYQNYHDDPEELANLQIRGKILYIFGNLIIFQIQNSRRQRRTQRQQISSANPYVIEFEPNRISIRVTQRAIAQLMNSKMESYLHHFESQDAISREEFNENFEWMNPSINENVEQQIAIKNIINCSAYPSPYIIFGGPGTGKSSTIVEAIAQIIKLKPRSQILVTTSSNSACDDIGSRLLKYVSLNKILRIYSPSFDSKPDKIDANLQKISNFRKRTVCNCKLRSCPVGDSLDDPSYEEFYTARVVIATIVSCGRFVSMGIKSDHFDYIFIDEAASECEARTLIPISGLGILNQNINTQFVLSGDHKQLGAIVSNRFAKRLGMELSIMERLMETDAKYQQVDNCYNPKYVTQLKLNYRNHPAIMHFSNANFYNSQLISMCSEETLNFAIESELLMYNDQFPIIFHTTKTPSKEVGTSLKNEGELNVLIYYLTVILQKGINGHKVQQSDIGIISPYRGQRDLLNEELQSQFPKLEIGTVDAFQGREKKIIMMSCVRSGTRHVGFLRNEKRLNVALTRAKALLIIIGNANTLQSCQIWNKFITYCYENNAVVGDVKSVNVAAVEDHNLAENEELPGSDIEDEFDG